MTVVEDHYSAWTHEFTKEEEVNEHIVKQVATVHERGICNEAFCHQSRQRELGSLAQQNAHSFDACARKRVPPGLAEAILECIDDHMTCLASRYQSLSNRQRRSAIRKANLDHHARTLGQKHIPKHVPIVGRDSNAIEVAFGAARNRTRLRQTGTHASNTRQEVGISRHAASIA